VGDDMRYARMGVERIVGSLPLGLRGDMRVGVALEAARFGSRYSETQRRGLLDSATVYLGGETPLGPVYLGAGMASGGSPSLYLFLGVP
jgi:NTE family protein